jgi:hypothetical protein
MPWAFIPVMMFTAMAPIQGIDWGNLVALALSAWLGNRHGRAGVIAVTIAWAAMSFRISVGDFTFGLRLDYGLTAILLAFVSAHPSPGLLLRGAFERALQSRIAWLVTLTAPVVVQLPLVANNERIYFGASIGFSLLVAVLPLLAAASRAPRTVYQLMILFVLLSFAGRWMELGLPYPRWMPGRGQPRTQLYALYGQLGLDRVVVAAVLGLAGVAICRLADAKAAPRLLLVPALLLVALAPYEVSFTLPLRDQLSLSNPSWFTATGALLAGVVGGALGFAVASLLSVASIALLFGWIFTEAPWLNALQKYTDDSLLHVTLSPPQIIYTPILAIIFGIVGAEIRATVLARRCANGA